MNISDTRKVLELILPLILTLTIGTSLLSGQAQTRITVEQIQQLIRLGTPDTAIALEIQRRGLELPPNKDLVQSLRSLGAGSATLQAIDDLIPMLVEAREAIPGTLTQIYQALDQANPQAARAVLSNELADNTRKLDAICKPFTYRAHYIESIVERRNRVFEVRVRVLFRPLDEHAYALIFAVSQHQFVLQDVTDPPQDWFGPEFAAASDLTRRFLYAMKAGRQDVLAQTVSPGVNTTVYATDSCRQLLLRDTNEFQINRVGLKSYKGLKIEVGANSPGTFLVEKINGEARIVAAFIGMADQDIRCRSAEDRSLETFTLKRFGLPVPTESDASLSEKPVLVPDDALRTQQPTASDPISGAWEIRAYAWRTKDGRMLPKNPDTTRAMLKLEGSKVTGTGIGASGVSVNVQGRWENNKLEFSYLDPDLKIPINVAGHLEENKLVGESHAMVPNGRAISVPTGGVMYPLKDLAIIWEGTRTTAVIQNTSANAAAQPPARKSQYPISSGVGVRTKFGIDNETFRTIQVYLDESDTPIVITGAHRYQDMLEIGSTHVMKAIVGGRTFQARFTVPRVMRDVHITDRGIIQ